MEVFYGLAKKPSGRRQCCVSSLFERCWPVVLREHPASCGRRTRKGPHTITWLASSVGLGTNVQTPHCSKRWVFHRFSNLSSKETYLRKKPQQEQKSRTKTRWHARKSPFRSDGDTQHCRTLSRTCGQVSSLSCHLCSSQSRDEGLTFPAPLLQFWAWVWSWGNGFRTNLWENLPSQRPLRRRVHRQLYSQHSLCFGSLGWIWISSIQRVNLKVK